jgi:predicted MFS family arabinose efflux permease
MFGSFTAYWTAVAYELIDHHHLTQNGVAVFALIGAAGAATAPIAGRLGDAGHSVGARIVALLAAIAAMALAGLGASSLILLAVAGVLLDFAVQSHQVLSLRDIYAPTNTDPIVRRRRRPSRSAACPSQRPAT